ncbi:MAG: acyl-ACP--UDP-N-acetylglucosamine O-acyltransferase [Candidatus Omnitrophica bacterium]|nr:acyl-ACP--UDP-N-acetylglucosamine O-acyltransferase [Candidatus Omnitrophota bacterium]
MSSKIHATAIIDPKARIDSTVSIGAYSVIGPNVTIGRDTAIGAHVVIEGDVKIGVNNQIFHGTVIGTPAQDKSYKGTPASVRIGSDNVIREYVTVHLSTREDQPTFIGDRNYLMTYTHAGHDSRIENDVTIANSAHLGGHVRIDSGVFVGGVVAFHQFVRVGEKAMIGGFSRIVRDVPPYALVQGNPAGLSGVNAVGLKRSGMKPDLILSIRKAYQHLFFKKGIFQELLETFEDNGIDELQKLKSFLSSGKRGITMRSKGV